MSWKTVSSKEIFRHPRITLIESQVELPSGEQVPYLTFGFNGHAATIICQRDDEVLLQKEYSYPMDEILTEFPGGGVNVDEPPVEGAQRELREETGLRADNLRELGWYYPTNRRSRAKMYVYLATGLSEAPLNSGDTEEEIVTQWIPVAKVDEMIRNGELTNFSVLAAWSLFKAHTTTAR